MELFTPEIKNTELEQICTNLNKSLRRDFCLWQEKKNLKIKLSTFKVFHWRNKSKFKTILKKNFVQII